jgi:predicted Kef-type K+ transport protein
MELSVVILAFCAGLAVRQLGYPPLLGYLAAGFAAHMMGLGDGEDFQSLADAGIVLLLFMIGLHLRASELAPSNIAHADCTATDHRCHLYRWNDLSAAAV